MIHRVRCSTICAITMVAIAMYAQTIQATLIRTNVADGVVVVDDVSNIQWADANLFAGLTYSQVVQEIDAMNSSSHAGANGWHLASLSELEGLFDQIVTVGDARKFDQTDDSSSTSEWILGRFDQIPHSESHSGATWRYSKSLDNASTAFFQKVSTGLNYTDEHTQPDLGAFVVSRRPAPVPEPGVVLLVMVGLLGVFGARKKR